MNIMNEEQVLGLYENLQCITHEMLVAAEKKDWEGFEQLGQKCHAEVDTLKKYDEITKLTGEKLEKKFQLINTILGTDRAIRLITEPWMRQLEQLMKNNTSTIKLESTYNTVAY
jgi:flagellar protein FliT